MHLLIYLDDLPTAAAALKMTDRLAEHFPVTADLLLRAGTKFDHPFAVLPPDRVTRRETSLPPEQAIPETCRSRHYDLVVAAPAGRNALVRLILGSRAGTLVQQAPASVLIARQTSVSIQHIVVGVSGSPHSAQDARLAGILARAFGAQLTLAHILSQVPLTYTSLQHMQMELEQFIASDDPAAGQLRRARELLAAEGLQADVLLREGLVRDELLALQKEVPVDLLVLGAHQRAEARLDYFEDFAEQVAVSASVSTLVVRAGPVWEAWQSK